MLAWFMIKITITIYSVGAQFTSRYFILYSVTPNRNRKIVISRFHSGHKLKNVKIFFYPMMIPIDFGLWFV
jgi:hypothetical protein